MGERSSAFRGAACWTLSAPVSLFLAENVTYPLFRMNAMTFRGGLAWFSACSESHTRLSREDLG